MLFALIVFGMAMYFLSPNPPILFAMAVALLFSQGGNLDIPVANGKTLEQHIRGKTLEEHMREARDHLEARMRQTRDLIEDRNKARRAVQKQLNRERRTRRKEAKRERRIQEEEAHDNAEPEADDIAKTEVQEIIGEAEVDDNVETDANGIVEETPDEWIQID
jgi:hypothetical protein